MRDEWSEPAITINGHPLTVAQAMTIRVAIGTFAMDLRTHGLGDDGHGAAMVQAYLTAIRDIHLLMGLIKPLTAP